MRFLFLLSVLFLAACSTGMPMEPYARADETPFAFELCHGYGCQERSAVSLNLEQWRVILSAFKPSALDGATEREQIAEAIGRMEALATKSAGLRMDKAEAAGTRDDKHAMDCIDETVNSDRTLRFLDMFGVLQFNAVADVVHRGYILDGQWPHNSAAVFDKASGEVYVIDSFYSAGGEAAHVVEFDEWMGGWRTAPAFDHAGEDDRN